MLRASALRAQSLSAHIYAIGLGSNRRHGRHGAPAAVIRAAIAALEADGLAVLATSPLISSIAVGPSRRSFANAAILVSTPDLPRRVLTRLKGLEKAFGRRRGQRWGARVIDLDILLWNGGRWSDTRLSIPHPAMMQRRFVLDPLAQIAGDWRIAGHGCTVRQAAARLSRRRALERENARSD